MAAASNIRTTNTLEVDKNTTLSHEKPIRAVLKNASKHTASTAHEAEGGRQNSLTSRQSRGAQSDTSSDFYDARSSVTTSITAGSKGKDEEVATYRKKMARYTDDAPYDLVDYDIKDIYLEKLGKTLEFAIDTISDPEVREQLKAIRWRQDYLRNKMHGWYLTSIIDKIKVNMDSDLLSSKLVKALNEHREGRMTLESQLSVIKEDTRLVHSRMERKGANLEHDQKALTLKEHALEVKERRYGEREKELAQRYAVLVRREEESNRMETEMNRVHTELSSQRKKARTPPTTISEARQASAEPTVRGTGAIGGQEEQGTEPQKEITTTVPTRTAHELVNMVSNTVRTKGFQNALLGDAVLRAKIREASKVMWSDWRSNVTLTGRSKPALDRRTRIEKARKAAGMLGVDYNGIDLRAPRRLRRRNGNE